jgi:histidine triad (HIT) family protein
MASIFAKIVNGQIPCYKIAENDFFLAFLDVSPVAHGHALVIPKKETDYIFDLDSDEYSSLWIFSRKVAEAQKKVIPCDRIGVSVIGLEVPHAHIHLIPISDLDDMNFSKERLSFTEAEFKATASLIAAAFLA